MKDKELRTLSWREIAIGVLGVAVIGSALLLYAGHEAARSQIASVKAENRDLEARLLKAEEEVSRLEGEKGELATDTSALKAADEDRTRQVIRELRASLNQKEIEYNTLKEEYSSTLEALNEVLQREAAAPEVGGEERRQEGRQRITPEQREEFMTSMRARSNEMMDRRIAEAATEYEAALLEEMKQRGANMFELFGKLRSATDDEQQAIREKIDEERRALGELNDQYNAYQWQSLAEKFGVKDVEGFIQQAQELSRSRRNRFMSAGGRWDRQP